MKNRKIRKVYPSGKGKRNTEGQIIGILQEVENGKAVAAVCREYGVAEAASGAGMGGWKGVN